MKKIFFDITVLFHFFVLVIYLLILEIKTNTYIASLSVTSMSVTSVDFSEFDHEE